VTDEKALLTLDEVAQRLGVSRDWARDHATRRNPRIPVVRLGGKRALLRFRPQDVAQFITEHLISSESQGV
jgi:excisionase family DNA binding protein